MPTNADEMEDVGNHPEPTPKGITAVKRPFPPCPDCKAEMRFKGTKKPKTKPHYHQFRCEKEGCGKGRLNVPVEN